MNEHKRAVRSTLGIHKYNADRHPTVLDSNAWAAAQINATMYLAEQQRIANVIALNQGREIQLSPEDLDALEVRSAKPKEPGELPSDVRLN